MLGKSLISRAGSLNHLAKPLPLLQPLPLLMPLPLLPIKHGSLNSVSIGGLGKHLGTPPQLGDSSHLEMSVIL